MIQCSVAVDLLTRLAGMADGQHPIRCEAAEELDGIRADLLVNFGAGSKHNKYGFSVEDVGTTRTMLIFVLNHLTKVKG